MLYLAKVFCSHILLGCHEKVFLNVKKGNLESHTGMRVVKCP